MSLIFFKLISGTAAKRRKDEVNRLNEAYGTLLPVKQTINKCLKSLAQTEPYRMLKNWTYELSANALEEDNTATTDYPDFTDVSIFIFILTLSDNVSFKNAYCFQGERTMENDPNDPELKSLTGDVIFNLSQELKKPNKAKMSRKKKNQRQKEVIQLFS